MTTTPVPPPRTGIITGLVAEANCLLKPRTQPAPRVLVSGGVPTRTRELAQALVAEGASGLVSFGVAGGLDPALVAGTILLPQEVLTRGGARFSTDPEWRSALSAALGGAGTDAPMLGSDRFIDTVTEKRALFLETGASAVDMESHVIAAVAEAAGLPFVVLRAITDPAGRALPAAAEAGLGPDGRTHPFAVVGALLRRPGELPAVLRLAQEHARALRALRRATLLGRGLLVLGV